MFSLEVLGATRRIGEIFILFESLQNSFASHKLLALAYKSKKQTQVVETLFYNYFIAGVDIGDIKELVRISKQHNIYQDDISIYLQSKEDRDYLLAEESHAKELGVTGVPCFIINKEFVLFGAQEKKNFLEIFNSINNVN